MVPPRKTPKPKAAAKKSTARLAAVKRTAAPTEAAPDEGAVTLEQAKAIVAARARARTPAPAGVSASALPPPTATSLRDVARERKQLAQAQRREQKQRIQDYKAVMQVMKQRGVEGMAPAEQAAAAAAGPGARGPLAASAPGGPLRVFAEGDSWFDYPYPLFGGSIIPRLEKRMGIPILNLAKAGDEVRFMMGVDERKLMAEQLSAGCPTGGEWEVLLFSGGGNDIVANPMALWVRDFVAGQPPEQLIHRPRFDAALAIVRAGYEDLIALRDALSPRTHLVFHAYDFALPDGRGVCHLGPWLKPTFDLRGFTSQQAGAKVVRLMLSDLASMLQALATAHQGVTFINGQGTLAAKPESWHNELHPSRQGFDKFADLFHARLKALFPSRMPA
ncbi:hypothetical protein WKW79_03055 [Variovorax robiniae]|uniref:SGNH hydrolase-type esterase domain-containing protein n=1 Tax=Variovorax robiniae TaxID=1836199 RepID=A0ABU8X1L8_9BURK